MEPGQILIKNIQEGDADSFKKFFEGFYPSVCIFAKKYLSDPATAEDVAQEAFIEFWRKRSRFTTLNTAKGFIYTVTRNKSINLIKANNLHKEILQQKLASDELFYEFIQEEETYRIIHQAIQKLASQSREIILLTLKGLKNQEIAEQLGVSVNTVKTLKRNAYKELRQQLQDHVFILFLLSQVLK
jgi:RNA polymerase sigma-70 factor (ECF subfamily)